MVLVLDDPILLLLGAESRDESGQCGVVPASRTDTEAQHCLAIAKSNAAAPRRRPHVTPALVHVPLDDGLRYRIHMLMQTRAAPMPYMCK